MNRWIRYSRGVNVRWQIEVAVDQGVARKDMLKWDEVDDKQEKSKKSPSAES